MVSWFNWDNISLFWSFIILWLIWLNKRWSYWTDYHTNPNWISTRASYCVHELTFCCLVSGWTTRTSIRRYQHGNQCKHFSFHSYVVVMPAALASFDLVSPDWHIYFQLFCWCNNSKDRSLGLRLLWHGCIELDRRHFVCMQFIRFEIVNATLFKA